MFQNIIRSFLFLSLILVPTISFTKATTLKLETIISTGSHRLAYKKLVEQFQKLHPHLRVELNIRLIEQHKALMEQWEAEGKIDSDIVYWFAGTRMHRFTRPGLVERITDMWSAQQLDKEFSPAIKAMVSYQGDVYAIPYGYYQWGFYYRKSIFQKYALKPPQDWGQLMHICETLKANNIYCFTVGSKNLWPLGGWFDYFNLRINGLEFHLKLLEGKVSFTDNRVRNIFITWKQLIDKGYFQPESSKRSWKQALPYIYRGKSAMMLTGNFVTTVISKKLLHDFAFVRFPRINRNLPYYEEAPTDIYFIPKSSKNKDAAKMFLAFLAKAESQDTLNRNLQQFSPNKYSQIKEGYFIQEGIKTLQSAEGFSQYLDRDTNKPMADAILKLLSQFIEKPEIERTLNLLEAKRQEIF